MKSDVLAKAMAWLDSPEGKADIQEFFAKEEAKAAERAAFYQTDRFNELIDLLKTHCANGGSVNNESVAYGTSPLAEHLTQDELWLLHSAITQNGHPCRTDPTTNWPTDGVVYDGLLFETISGQGTILIIKTAPEDCYANKTFNLTEEVVFVGNDYGLEAMYHKGKRIELESDNVTDILEALGISTRIISLDESELKDNLNDIEGIVWNTDNQ